MTSLGAAGRLAGAARAGGTRGGARARRWVPARGRADAEAKEASSAPHLRGTEGGRTATSAVVARRRGKPSAWRAERRWTEGTKDAPGVSGVVVVGNVASHRDAPRRVPRASRARAGARVRWRVDRLREKRQQPHTRVVRPRAVNQRYTERSSRQRSRALPGSRPLRLRSCPRSRSCDASAPGEEHAPSALTPERRVEKEWEDQLALAKEQEVARTCPTSPCATCTASRACTTTPTCTTTGRTARTPPLRGRHGLEHGVLRAARARHGDRPGPNDALRGLKKCARCGATSTRAPSRRGARAHGRGGARGVRARARGGGRACSAASARLPEAEAAEREASLRASRVSGAPDSSPRAHELRERREAIEERGGSRSGRS